MTTHYIATLGLKKCREILKGAPESNYPVKWGLNFNTYFRQVGYGIEQWHEGKWQTRYSDKNWIDLNSLRHELALHDTDDFTHLENHISPLTVVEENLQEQFQMMGEGDE